MVKESVTLLLGSETALRDRHIEEVRKRTFSDPASGAMNEIRWDASKDSLQDLLSHMQTAPFLADKRLAIIDQVDKLKVEPQKMLAACIEKTASRGVWILMTDERKAKNKWLQTLAKMGQSHECAAPYREGDIRGWIVKRFRELGKTADPRVANLLMERVGKSLTLLDSAIERLTIYCMSKDTVESVDAEALLGRSAEENAFELLRTAKIGGGHEAVRISRALQSEGLTATAILRPIAFQMEQLLKVKNCLAMGLGAGDVAQRFFWGNTYRAKESTDLARALNPERIQKDLLLILDCEEGIKGALQETEALENCLLRLSE